MSSNPRLGQLATIATALRGDLCLPHRSDREQPKIGTYWRLLGTYM